MSANDIVTQALERAEKDGSDPYLAGITARNEERRILRDDAWKRERDSEVACEM